MLLEHVDEKTFQMELVDIDAFQYQVAKQIYEKYGDQNIPLMVANDKKSLIFKALSTSIDNKKYRVRIEVLDGEN